MSEKGGKGFAHGKGAPVKGKEGRKVHFNGEDQDSPTNISSQFGGKGDTPMGDPLKVGKGGKTVSGGKNSVPKETKYELNIQPELPKNAQCVMDCEAADILQGIQEQMVFLSRDPTIKLPISFDKGLQYAKSGARYSNPERVRQVLANLKRRGASDGEICVIANASPETIDEVFALLPSLKAKRSKMTEPLKQALAELIQLRVAKEGLEG